MPNKRIIVAHRGWSSRAPENTMAAFRLAMNDPRISWIELDVQLSKDGVPVVIHDYKLKRTTGASGSVKDYTLDQLRKLDYGSWFSPEFHKERIPTLEQVLKECKGRILLNIELKTIGNLYPGLEQKVIDLVKAYSMEADVVITSFEPTAVKQTKKLSPNLRTGLIVSILPHTIKDQLRIWGASLLSADYRLLDETVVHHLVNSGIDIMAWTVNDSKNIEHVLGLHPDLWICTNYPERVFPYVSFS
jgi:glycerophosphoryl diester phosphodiesterase